MNRNNGDAPTMRFGGLALSISLHIIILASLVLIKPMPVINLTDPVMQISLSMDEPGGNDTPSPVLGHVTPKVPAKDAPDIVKVADVKAKPLPRNEKKKPEEDILKTALTNARKGAAANPLAAALDAARRAEKNVAAGGGGDDGRGGGGLYDLYAGQIILAVRPNWSMPTYNRDILTANVRVIVDGNGTVLETWLETTSGRPDFDASAINAVLRTQRLPLPPTPAQRDIVIRFNSLELMSQ